MRRAHFLARAEKCSGLKVRWTQQHRATDFKVNSEKIPDSSQKSLFQPVSAKVAAIKKAAMSRDNSSCEKNDL